MFNGKVQYTGVIIEVVPVLTFNMYVTFKVDKMDYSQLKVGDIISHNGCSLTIKHIHPDSHSVLINKNTLDRTTGLDIVGNIINIENQLKIGEVLNRCYVTGIIDGVAVVDTIIKKEDGWRVIFRLSPFLSKYLLKNSNITLNGVSVTIINVKQDNFEIYLSIHTIMVSNFKMLESRSKVNVEIDNIAKYVYSYMTKIGGIY